jgi:putative endonuclease
MLGDRGEAIAVDWYRRNGYDIIATNVRVGRNELDLICRTDDEIVFVEVKTGCSDEYGAPLYRVDRYKVRALIYAAQRWLLGHPQGHRGIRFYVISIETDRDPPAIDHRPAAFSADFA